MQASLPQASQQESKSFSSLASPTADRDSKFKTLTEEDVSNLKDIVSEVGIVTDESQLNEVNTDWTNTWKG